MQPNELHTSSEPQPVSLWELNRRVRYAMNETFPGTYWVQAETSDVRVNSSSGHCYLEFIEKHPVNGQLIAKVRGSIWANTFRRLKAYFEQATGQVFTSGIKVMVRVSVEFHELYGFSLTVADIDPTYTLGDMVRKRMEIIRRLQEEGVYTLNKELPFPALPQRIAVITSPTAAGYEDFVNQLIHNPAGYTFYIKLFPALMQGDKTESSIIAALERLFQHQEYFDVAVIIRGGGSTADLSSFDSYLLAANCAQFPLPVITGIGHERDDTVLDMIAHTRLKTPTAVAEFLIEHVDTAAREVTGLQQNIQQIASGYLTGQKNFLQLTGTRLPSIVANRLERNRTVLQSLTGRLPSLASSLLSGHNTSLDNLQNRLRNNITLLFNEQNRQLQLTSQFIKMASPDYILARGYSLTLKDGHIVKKAAGLQAGDMLVTRMADGEVRSKVINDQ